MTLFTQHNKTEEMRFTITVWRRSNAGRPLVITHCHRT